MPTHALSFVSFQPVLPPRHARQTVQKRARPLSSCSYFAHIPRACATPPPSPQPNDTLPDMKIPGTPCFTSRIMASPMPSDRRHVYLQAAAAATASYLADFQPGTSAPVSQVTLLVPQLNPELDVYDRRFLLSLAWAVLDVTAFSCRLRSRVLIQGTGAFGAVPLSVSGLRRNFDADLNMSQEAWTENIIRSGALENVDDLDDQDDIVIVVSPTNAVSIPVIDNLTDMVARARGRPVILLNPRLADVPSHSGVMQVSGRAERVRFLENIDHIFYLRLLFSAGKSYPLRGILHRAYPGQWQVWRSENEDTNYRLISSAPERPLADDITTSFAQDRYAQQKRRMENTAASGSPASLESLLASPAAFAIIAIGMTLAVARFLGTDIQLLVNGTLRG